MGIRPLRPAVFLDRDGVVNDAVIRNGKPHPPDSAAEARVAQDAPDALARLAAAGLPLIVVTNQPDVARGKQTATAVEEIHRVLKARLPIDDFLSCFHDDGDACACRKPKPGLILEAADRHGVNLGRSFMVGDRWRDIDAGRAAGCRTVWIDRGYAERGPSAPADARVGTLAEAADWILKAMSEEHAS